ncbi:hypothetical protein DPMN_192750 [Dreissena polymorpha]|uniref:Uncharacterized protein n=1 Tax=Dreissena polymorpha TaxID=45954 RepID=A0A9D4BD91_DREPO|nr:hypothetical protein DPMN_192750 [Dreissena polymorpha]
MGKARGVNPDIKSGAGVPKAVWPCPQGHSGNSCDNAGAKLYRSTVPLGPSAAWRGGPDAWVTQDLHTFLPRLAP